MGCTAVHAVVSADVAQCFMVFPISALIFSIPMWFLCSCCSICLCASKGFITFCLSLQCHKSLLIHFLSASIVLCSEGLLPPCMASPILCMLSALYYMFSVPAGVHPHVLQLVCFFIDVHSGMFTYILKTFTFTIIPAFLISVFHMGAAGQPVHDVPVWARPIYDVHHVLVYS